MLSPLAICLSIKIMFSGWSVLCIMLAKPSYTLWFDKTDARISDSSGDQFQIPLPSDGFLFDLLEPWEVRELFIRKQRICRCNSCSTHFHVSQLSDFIFYPKPLYKSLHQSFFYSFITILPAESGVTLHYSTIFPQILLFRHLTYFHFRIYTRDLAIITE